DELGGSFAALPAVERAEVAGPGFVNLFLSDAWLASTLAGTLREGRAFGSGSAAARERVQVELVSANPTGPLTVASARNGAFGDSVARLLEFAGHDVAREHYVNDLGAQIDLFRLSVEARARGEDPPEGGYTGGYVEGLAEAGGDPVERMIDEIQESLARFRVQVDDWVRESKLDVESALA